MEDKAPGFRFYPTEEELLLFYLHNKLHDKRQDLHRVIPVLNIFQLDPWHLPQNAGQLCNQDPEQWFFFAPRQHREACGGRPNRITSSGYWKATGSPSYVYSSENQVIGVKKTMVFYKGKAPTGRKTKWKLNEYRAIEGGSATSKLRHEFSLCRVYISSGCLRAFDRRPSGTLVKQTPIHEQQANQVIVTQTPIHEQQANQAMVTSTTYKSSGEEAAEKPSSTDSSSLGEDTHNLPLAEADGDHLKMMTNDPYPLWELEQLNWLFGQQSGTDPVADDEVEEVSLKKLTRK